MHCGNAVTVQTHDKHCGKDNLKSYSKHWQEQKQKKKQVEISTQRRKTCFVFIFTDTYEAFGLN